jgi:hypothetical protein
MRLGGRAHRSGIAGTERNRDPDPAARAEPDPAVEPNANAESIS